MTGNELATRALRLIGNTNPQPNEISNAFGTLNGILSNWAYWDSDVLPIQYISDATATINLPLYYLEIFELLVAAREAIAYGFSGANIALLESKAQQLTNRLTYRSLLSHGNNIAAATLVV